MCENKRTYGIELEGYVNTNLLGKKIGQFKIIEDGSLGDMDECGACDGSGNEWVRCSECDGDLRVPCESCENGEWYDEENDEWHTCEECNGDGEVRCDSCDGDGGDYESCESCGGSGNDGTNQGIECVSGILNEGEFDAISEIFDYINDHSWNACKSECGTHVHVGGKDLTALDLSKLTILMNVAETIFFGVSDNYRYSDDGYSHMMNRSLVRGMIEKGENITFADIGNMYYEYDSFGNDEYILEDHHFEKYQSERYNALNLHSWFYRRTVEFRYFEGCVSEEKAQMYIKMAVGMVNLAKAITFDHTLYIARNLYNLEQDERIAGLEKLLGMENEIEVVNAYVYNRVDNNVVDELRVLPDSSEDVAV